jgi:hypothetical protein
MPAVSRGVDPGVLGIIQFFRAPTGDGSLYYRGRWIGVRMPCLYVLEKGDKLFEVIVKDLEPGTTRAYVVLQQHAIAALEHIEEGSADWLIDQGYPQSGSAMFSFGAECIKEVKRVMSRAEFDALHRSRLNS